MREVPKEPTLQMVPFGAYLGNVARSLSKDTTLSVTVALGVLRVENAIFSLLDRTSVHKTEALLTAFPTLIAFCVDIFTDLTTHHTRDSLKPDVTDGTVIRDKEDKKASRIRQKRLLFLQRSPIQRSKANGYMRTVLGCEGNVVPRKVLL